MTQSINSYELSNQDETIMNLERGQAIEVIMNTYGNEIKRLVYSYMKNNADTDDVTQEVFVTVYKKIHTFQGNSSLKSWIYSIAINQCRDHLRSWQMRNRKLTKRLTKALRFNHNTESSPEGELIDSSKTNELISLTMSLPVKYREVIILFYFEDFSTKEISEMLQIKDATIRTRLRRARERLRNIINTERSEEFGS